jgi:hypothetical protein
MGEFLATSTNVHVYDEVCNAHAVDPNHDKASFFRFQSCFVASIGQKYYVPTESNQMLLGERFFKFLLEAQHAEHIVVDIKYGHIRNFDWFWTPLFRRPLLFQICEVNEFQILHLYRDNVVDAAISAAIAEKRQVWHSWQVNEVSGSEKIAIPVEAVVSAATLLREQVKWIKGRWLPGCRHREVTYESFTSSLINGDRKTLDSLASFVGGSAPQHFLPKLQKLGRHPREQLSNADQLRDACEKGGLGAFVNWETN